MPATTSPSDRARRRQAGRRRRPQRRLRRGRPGRRSRGRPPARLAVRHPQLRRRRPAAGGGRLPGDRPLPARLRLDALPLRRDAPQRRAGRARASTPIALMDALGIETAVVAGFDWGARTADIVAALWPERCNGLVSVSGYLIGSQAAGKAAAAAGGRAAVVVPVLLRHRARPGRLRAIPPRVREADLADRVPAVGLRRRDVRRAARRRSTTPTTSRS